MRRGRISVSHSETGIASPWSGTSASRNVALPVDPVPRRQEAAEGELLRRLDLTAEHGERGAADTAKDVGIAPLALDTARPQLAADEQVTVLERGEKDARRRRARARTATRRRGW